MPSQVRIAEIIDNSTTPTQPSITLQASQVRITEIIDNSTIPTQPSIALQASQVRIANILSVTSFQLLESLSIREDRQRKISLQEALETRDNLHRQLTLQEGFVVKEDKANRTSVEVATINEERRTQFRRHWEENTSIITTVQRLSPLILSETFHIDDKNVKGYFIYEPVGILETRKVIRYLAEMPLIVHDIALLAKIVEDEITDKPEIYSSVRSLFSIGFSALWTLTAFVKELRLSEKVSSHQETKRITDLPYSVGIYHKPEPYWQKYATSVEDWEHVFVNRPSWLAGYIVRDVLVDRKRVVLVLLRTTLDLSSLRLKNIRYCRIVIIDFNFNPPQVTMLKEFPLFPDAKDKFGFFTVGHGVIVGIIGNQAIGVTFAENTGEAQFLRFAYISDEYRRTNPQFVSILTVPEGFVFLPVAILYDLETFHNLPSLPSNNLLLPVYTNKPLVVEREVREGQVNIGRCFVWEGLGPKFVEAVVVPPPNYPSVAPAIKGDTLRNSWISWGLSGDNAEEHLLFKYNATFNTENEQWELHLDSLPYAYFPLPTVGIWTYLPTTDYRWTELTLSVVSNGEVVYFSRLWQRIYRAQLSAENHLKVTHTYSWEGLLGEFAEKTAENPLIPFLAYDRYYGQVYAVFASIPPSDPVLVIARQTLPYSPPPQPTIVFPYNNWVVSRRPVVIIRPAVYHQPQEFLIRFVPKVFVERYGVQVENAPGYEFYSAADRTGWEISLDGGVTWQPMTDAVLRDDESDNILVRFNTPSALPQTDYYYVLVSAYTRRG